MIEFQHVSKTYPNGVKGLKDVNLTIEQGEFVAIIGLSGAGKSTLIRTINRMIDVTEGTLTVDGVTLQSGYGSLNYAYTLTGDIDVSMIIGRDWDTGSFDGTVAITTK